MHMARFRVSNWTVTISQRASIWPRSTNTCSKWTQTRTPEEQHSNFSTCFWDSKWSYLNSKKSSQVRGTSTFDPMDVGSNPGRPRMDFYIRKMYTTRGTSSFSNQCGEMIEAPRRGYFCAKYVVKCVNT